MRDQALVIDDDPRVLHTLSTMLAVNGVDVVAERDSTRGLALMKSGRFDILFAEECAPGRTDLELLSSASECVPTLPVVVLTACESIESLVRAFRLGATDYLHKPLRADDVTAALARGRAKSTRLRAERCATPPPRSGPGAIPASIVAASPAMKLVAEKCAHIAESSLPILVVGELGVGKETLVRLIHSLSARRDLPCVKVNCDAMQESCLRESFFGSVGSSDGGHGAERGLIEQAADGTLLLQNVTGLPRWMQKELGHAARAGTFYREGERTPVTFRARLAATTPTAPAESINAGLLLNEFYYHIGVTALNVPPLRSRREDIQPLVELFTEEASNDSTLCHRSEPLKFAADAMHSLEAYDWLGNIHELRNFIRRVFVFAGEPVISARRVAELLPSVTSPGGTATITVPLVGDMKVIERAIVAEAILRAQGNKSAAARSLGVHRKTLYRIIESENREKALGAPVENC